MSPRSRKRGGKRPQRRQQQARERTPDFWGDAAKLPAARAEVRIAEDPPAVARSLGPPPLPGHETIAEHHFTVVYDRTVMLAGALAAAGGLIEPERLVEERSE